ncbi:MAG TPA: histidine kinase, partial [Candidatus Acidoferrales bacterium]|nr:histidine kinase [Candidatus Acidoferrales bacterium]
MGIIPAPVVNNGGIHGSVEVSGQVHLAAGLQPIQLFYFNAAEPSELTVSYSGPDIPFQPVPDGVLFRESASGGTNLMPGLTFACYEDMPATMDDLRHAEPVYTGVATNFDISLRQQDEFVAMQFRGLIAISHPGDYTFSTLSDDGSELYVGRLPGEVNVVGSNCPPSAVSLPAREPVPTSGLGEWATVTGQVTFSGEDSDGPNLEIKVGNDTLSLHLAGQAGLPASLLQNAKLRATGVCRGATGSDGAYHSGQIVVVDAANLSILSLVDEQWGKHPVINIANLPAGQPGAKSYIAHLHGRIAIRASGEDYDLSDGTGTIAVRSLAGTAVTNGMTIDLLGNVESEPSGKMVVWAFARPFELSPGILEPLSTAAQVQQLSATEAARHHPVCVRGVITCLVEWSGAVIQDSTRGVFFSFQPTYLDGLVPGDYAEVCGVTDVGDFAPIIAADSVRVLRTGEFPAPARPSWKQLINGSLDAQYAEVRGVITAVSSNEVSLLTESGKIKVIVHNTGETTLKKFLNTLVRIRGCLLAVWDAQTRQVKVGEIVFRNPRIEVDQLPMIEPFSAPTRTIADLLLFDLQASGFQRVKVSGQVVHVGGGEVFLMQGGHGLRFQPVANGPKLRAGDMVEVVGIPDLSGPSPQLHEAVVRRTGFAPLPDPLAWPDLGNSSQNLDAVRVRMKARLIDLHHTGSEWVLELQAGLRACRALINTSDDLAKDLPLGSQLEVTGIYATLNDLHPDDLSAFEILLNSRADIQVLARPPWWTLRRLFVIVAALLGVLAAAAIWIKQLQKQVVQRTALLEREHAKRESAERERAVEFERSRIARDLHDDLGSSLSEIRVLASSGQRLRAADGKVPSLFHAITEKARSLIAALDVIVWAVDPGDNSLQSLADYLSGFAAEYLENANIACRFKIPVSLPDGILD